MEEDKAEGMCDNGCTIDYHRCFSDPTTEDHRCLSDHKINGENTWKRKQEGVDYDREIKCGNTIGDHQRDALAQMDCDDQVVLKKSRDPKMALGLAWIRACASPKPKKSNAEELDMESDK